MSKARVTRTTQERFVDLFMGIVLLFSLLAATGWLVNKPVLASLSPVFVPMAPSSALIFIGLWLTWFVRRIFNAWRGMRIVIPAIQVGMMIIVLLLAFRALTGQGPDLEKIIYPNPPLLGQIATGRMSPLSALGFLLTIPALLLITSREPSQQVKTITASLALVLFSLNGLFIIGYMYGAPFFYGGTTIPVSLTSALSFFFLSLGLLEMTGPATWPLNMYMGHTLRARLMRAFIPAMILIALFQGLLSTAADPWIINPALRVAVAAIVAGFIVVFIISYMVKNLSADFERGKQAEEALEKSEAELRALFASMKDVVIVYDFDGRYIEIAPTNPANLYRPAEEMLGRTLHDILPKEQADYNIAMVRESIQTGKVVNGEYALKVGDKEIWFAASTSRLSETTAILVAHDITQRKLAEQTLRESESRFHAIFEQAAIGVAEINSLTGEFVRVNQKYCQIFGYSREEMLRMRFQEISHPDDLPDDLERMKKLLNGEIDSFTIEKRHYRSNHAIIWLNLTVSPLWAPGEKPDYHIAVIEDITERKQSEQKLLELSMAVDNTSEAIFMTDREGIITFVNPGFTYLYGYTPDEIVGKTTPRILKSGFMKQEDYTAFWKTLVDKQVMKGELINKTKDGHMLNIEGSANPILNPKGEVIGYLAIQHDITQRKRYELVQNAVYRITQASITAEGIDELYHSIHSILGELIPAENFYIALIDKDNGQIGFPYYVDQYDERPDGQTPIQGLTGYVIRTGHPLLANPEVFNRLVQQGEVDVVGTRGEDWMGAPLKLEGRVIGVLAVQSYSKGIHFNQQDLNLLEFVSTQVAQVIERKRMEQEIVSLNLTDELTGLHNRRGFMLLAEHEMKLAYRFKRGVSLFFCDLDDLKTINDSFGHAEGDEALKEVSAIIKETFREADIPARIGGDEFVILAPDTSIDSTHILPDRLQTTVDNHNLKGGRLYRLSLSVGISRFNPEIPHSVDELISEADKLMYLQKKEKKGKSTPAGI